MFDSNGRLALGPLSQTMTLGSKGFIECKGQVCVVRWDRPNSFVSDSKSS